MMKRGFTLIEVTVALGVLAILVGSVAPLAVRINEKVDLTKTRKEMRDIETALLQYYRDLGNFPARATTAQLTASSNNRSLPLEQLITGSATPPGTHNWNGPYISKPIFDLRRDAWGSHYLYDTAFPGDTNISGWTINTDMAILVSVGPDLTYSTTADGSIGGTWKPEGSTDTLIRPISAFQTRRDVVRSTITKINVLMTQSSALYDRFNEVVTGDLDIEEAYGTTFDNCFSSDSPTCPAKILVSSNGVSPFHARDEWGNLLRWHVETKQFYSMGPDATDNSDDENICGDDISGFYYNLASC